METKLYNFIDIFNTYFNVDSERVRLEKIVIPIIQRDYAQGRKVADVARIRNRFLEALSDALTGSSITLDFVYGDLDNNGVLTLLDGQQRLTTLFLLHWYAAKKENIPIEEYSFLYNFSYETRYSARAFCHELVKYTPSFTSETIEMEIVDQPWFPLDWKKDPTISSMLVMLDAIRNSFSEIKNIWLKLKEGCINFYFLPIKDMGLTDELYIKMNSRGKPLTNFEHFKAELEKQLYKYNKDVSKRIIKKIDIDWTDMLWQYRGDDNVTDDEFLRYFSFICDIICYLNNQSPQDKSHDSLDLLETYFSNQTEHLEYNINILETYFDCWCKIGENKTPADFCNSIMSIKHEEGKVKIDNHYEIDIFNDCLRTYGELQSNRNRKFPLGRIVILYALISHLQHQTVDLVRRLRIVNNLVMNSEDEISDSVSRQGGNRMPAILRQVDSIIQNGEIKNMDEPNFNVNQLQEEIDKIKWVKKNPDKAELLFKLEEHPLLYGQIGAVGLEHTEYYERFASLFNCTREVVGEALLVFGDYKQQERNEWRYQLGTDMEFSWKFLFHKGSSLGFENTKNILLKLLSTSEEFSNEYLKEIVNGQLVKCEQQNYYDWKYYYLKYPSFRLQRFGKYEWNDYENSPYIFNALYTRYYPSENSYLPYLCEIDNEHINRDDYGRSILFNNKIIKMENNSFCIYNVDTNEQIYRLDIPMNDDGIDIVDRIQYVKSDMIFKKILCK